MLDDFRDISIVARSNFTQDTLRNPDNTANKPVPLSGDLSIPHLLKGLDNRELTQNTPIVLNEQYGGRSGLIMQNIPWSCQLTKKTMNRWWEYQNRSKWARRRFSMAKKTIVPNAAVMIQPVIPGPVVKLAARKAKNLCPVVLASGSAAASFAKFTMCAAICTTEPITIDHAVAIWKVMFLSNGMMSLRGVRRRNEMKLRQTGRRI